MTVRTPLRARARLLKTAHPDKGGDAAAFLQARDTLARGRGLSAGVCLCVR